MAGKNEPLDWLCYLVDREENTCIKAETIPNELKVQWVQRLGQAVSDYYTQHPEEYGKLNGEK